MGRVPELNLVVMSDLFFHSLIPLVVFQAVPPPLSTCRTGGLVNSVPTPADFIITMTEEWNVWVGGKYPRDEKKGVVIFTNY